mmetsp:Transcript_62411/g.122794  ORF Transcript_62411/g.122794 Transcript_62411/m.122794 type:complete len:431 (-) Transcript_62411:86-1378(-)
MLMAIVLLLLSLVGYHCRLLYQLSNIQKFSPSSLRESLNNQRIIMVGDSLMRYQYLSLAYLARTGNFPEAESGNDQITFVSDKSWEDYYQYTNRLLAPYEIIDYYRPATNLIEDHHREMRYYRDDARNISLYYARYFGDSVSIRGLIRPNPDSGLMERSDSEWTFTAIHEFLGNVSELFSPRPNTLVLNAGFHSHRYDLTEVREVVAKTALEYFDRVFWKTTNFPMDKLSQEDDKPHDLAMCAMAGIECFDLKWTSILEQKDMVDLLHFQPQIYADMNIQFIELLRRNPIPQFHLSEHKGAIIKVSDPSNSELVFISDTSGRLWLNEDLGGLTNCTGLLAAKMPQYQINKSELLTHIAAGTITDACSWEKKMFGLVLRETNGRSIFLFENGFRREFQSFDAFVKMGLDLDQVKVVLPTDLARLPIGKPIF